MEITNNKVLQKSITQRDIAIFEYIGRYGFATKKALFEKFWKSKLQSGSHYRRFMRLEELGLVENIKGDNGDLGLKLTDKGIAYMKSLGQEFSHLKPFKRSYRTQFSHDSVVQGVLYLMSLEPVVTAIESEKELFHRLYGELPSRPKKLQKGVPDGGCLLKTKKGYQKVALEVELTRKSNKRYEAIMRRQMTTLQWDIVLYLVKGKTLLETLMYEHQKSLDNDQIVRTSDKINGVYFADLEEFISSPKETIFKNNHDSFCLKDLE